MMAKVSIKILTLSDQLNCTESLSREVDCNVMIGRYSCKIVGVGALTWMHE